MDEATNEPAAPLARTPVPSPGPANAPTCPIVERATRTAVDAASSSTGPCDVQQAWSKTRRHVAESYCRVVAVIDDQIERTAVPLLEGAEKPGEAVSVTPRFWQLRRDFQNKNILCHLHSYPQRAAGPDNAQGEELVDSAVSVASAANVVVLDWHLGESLGSEHAEAILEKLVEMGGLRFIVINSLEQPTVVRDRLTQRGFSVPLEFSTQPLRAAPSTIGATLGKSIFILIRKKEDQTEADAANLVNAVFEWLESRFPDHLQWAGLELSARVSQMLPTIIGALPSATDVPLFHQWLFNENSETNEQVVAFLLDELGIQFGLHPLQALNDECIKERITEKMRALVSPDLMLKPIAADLWKNVDMIKAELKKIAEGKPSEDKSALAVFKLIETWEKECIQAAKSVPGADLLSHFPGPKKNFSKEQRIATHLTHAFDQKNAAFAAWAALYESSLGDLGSPKRLFTGFVLQKTSEIAADPGWLLCVTPGCDCRWEKAEAFAFLPGTDADGEPSADEIVTCINTKDGAKTITWNPRQIVLKQKSTKGGLIDGYTLAGSIRPLHAVRIAQRTWVHQMRVAVDVPDYMRSRRKEGER